MNYQQIADNLRGLGIREDVCQAIQGAEALKETCERLATLSADIACYCGDVRRGLRDGAGLLDLETKAKALNAEARGAIALTIFNP